MDLGILLCTGPLKYIFFKCVCIFSGVYVRVSVESRDAAKSRKNKHRPVESPSLQSIDLEKTFSIVPKGSVPYFGKKVNVVAEHDCSNNLRHLKFLNNKKIPQGVLQIVNMILHFHPHLSAVTLRRGLDKQVLHQLSQMQVLGNITELCIEQCYLEEGCYYILLESQKNLKYLSLPRCSIDDDALEAISTRLLPPYKAFKTLIALDLSSNRITDEGAKSLAEILRTNRRLSYLSLMNNVIGDEGATALLDTLMIFPLRPQESTDIKLRRAQFMAYKSALVARTIAEMKAEELLRRKPFKRLHSSPKLRSSKGSDKDMSRTRSSDRSSFLALSAALYDKAKSSIDLMVGEFRHAYSEKNTVHNADGLYCRGNDALNYLNLAYNNLSAVALRHLVKVVTAQRVAMRGGLISVNLDGNPMPHDSYFFTEVDESLQMRLASLMPGRQLLGGKVNRLRTGKNPR